MHEPARYRRLLQALNHFRDGDKKEGKSDNGLADAAGLAVDVAGGIFDVLDIFS